MTREKLAAAEKLADLLDNQQMPDSAKPDVTLGELRALRADLAALDAPAQPATPARWPVRSEMPLTDAAYAEQRWQARHAEPVHPQGHAFQHIDPEASCPICGFPSWTHDPATAFMYRQPVHPEPLTDAAYAEQRWQARHAEPVHPEPLDVERLQEAAARVSRRLSTSSSAAWWRAVVLEYQRLREASEPEGDR